MTPTPDGPPERNSEISELRDLVRDLTARVYRLEERLNSAQPYVARPRPSTAEPRASFESRVGAQFLNRAGIVALLLGASFAVHWAYTSNWIGPEAIVFIGLLGGIATFLLGRWFVARRYTAFGISLEGLGLAAIYLILWAAFQIFQIIPALVAIAGMIIVTAASVATAILQDSMPLAILAFLGGFATPLLLSTGQTLQSEFFFYITVLSVGMLATVAVKRWGPLLVASFFGCTVVVSVWFDSYFRANNDVATLSFVTLLFAIFIAATFIIRGQTTSVAIVVPLATAVYLLAAYAAYKLDIDLIELFTGIALIILSQRFKDHYRALYATTGLASLGLAVAAHYDGWTTSFLWLLFGGILILVGFYTGLRFLRWDALVLLGITICKIFIYDLSRLGTGYRILAMAVLGVILLAISFTYQSNWLRPRR